jgi:hypothetical protein
MNNEKTTDEKLIKERIKSGKDPCDISKSVKSIPMKDNKNLPIKYDIYLKKFLGEYKSYIPGWGKMCIITAATGNYNVKLPPVKKHNIDAYVFGDANITTVEGWTHIKKIIL